MILYEELSQQIIGAAIEGHRHLGPGLIESAYEECLCCELALRGIGFKRQLALPVVYKSVTVEGGYRIDLLMEDKIIVEIKSLASIPPVAEAQLMTYLRLSQKRVALLINFNVEVLKSGIIRRVL